MGNGNGAPYNLIVTVPERETERTYSCADKDTVLTSLTTLALVHINENIRTRNGVRMMFEIVSAPPKEVEDADPASGTDPTGD
jgi:hypothetical protein